MSAYKSFAVVGGGTVGLPIVNALVAQNASVILLSRPESANKAVPSGVQVVKVDFKDATAVAAIFKQHKVDVVLATITASAAAAQAPLIEAAKLAAVKLFVPSEYGMPSEGHDVGVLADKQRVADSLKAAGIPSVRVHTGIFIDIVPWLVGYSEHGKFRIVGKGEAPISFTSVKDIAGFVAYVLTTLPPSELENREFRLEGDRSSLNALAAQFKTTVEYVDRITGEGGDIKTRLMNFVDTGVGSTGWNEAKKTEESGDKAAGSANALWKDHQWETIKDVYHL
ncbi:hypothetical protein B0H11DRAFT_1846297 [Mycena galericulata]|nr:hypothetical protein B0H11DRAFT_1846297 [Mycena galericulata]